MIKYEMRMLPAKNEAQSVSLASTARGVPTVPPFGPSGSELAANTKLGANLTTGQKKLIAFAAGVAVGMFLKRKK